MAWHRDQQNKVKVSNKALVRVVQKLDRSSDQDFLSSGRSDKIANDVFSLCLRRAVQSLCESPSRCCCCCPRQTPLRYSGMDGADKRSFYARECHQIQCSVVFVPHPVLSWSRNPFFVPLEIVIVSLHTSSIWRHCFFHLVCMVYLEVYFNVRSPPTTSVHTVRSNTLSGLESHRSGKSGAFVCCR